jgi:hypothetical protein
MATFAPGTAQSCSDEALVSCGSKASNASPGVFVTTVIAESAGDLCSQGLTSTRTSNGTSGSRIEYSCTFARYSRSRASPVTWSSPHPAAPWRTDSREKTPIPCSIAAASVSYSAVAVMYTAWPVPGGTVESNTTRATCGRTAMFCEWRAPG